MINLRRQFSDPHHTFKIVCLLARIFEKTGSDVVILYGLDNKVSIRRSNNLISCRKIALNLPEGGRSRFVGTQGFNSPSFDRDQIIKELEEAVSRSLVDTSSPQ